MNLIKNKLFKQPAGFHREVITDVTKWKHPGQKNEINFQKVQFLLGPPEPGFKTESIPTDLYVKMYNSKTEMNLQVLKQTNNHFGLCG